MDPPPIVELRIFEGNDEERDVTFQLSANYFLFATLEPARPTAQGRVPQDTSRSSVLTGTPVAGMVYLERPIPAGYFLFPDLSVRHEGFFRLCFNLYEELKDPNDGDDTIENDGEAPGFCPAQVTHRLEVKSTPFLVWSAKKFPGLSSSTELSRCVAEQGCRVRIRREIRLRKRKGAKDAHDGFSEDGHDGPRHSHTPDMYQQPHISVPHNMVASSERGRTASISSSHTLVGLPDGRRSSLQEMPAYSQAQCPPPPVIMSQNGQPGSVPQNQYAGASPASQQYPGYAYQQPMPAPPMPYQDYQYGRSMAPTLGQGYQYQQTSQAQHQVSQYEPQVHMRNGSSDYTGSNSTDSRRSSVMAPPPPSLYGYGQQNQSMYPSGNSGYSMAGHMLPPINTTLQTRDKMEPSTPAVPVPTWYGQYGDGVNHQQMGDSSSQTGSKRSYDRVFNTGAVVHEALRDGARPSAPYAQANGSRGNNEGLQMLYRRADGREMARPLPPSI